MDDIDMELKYKDAVLTMNIDLMSARVVAHVKGTGLHCERKGDTGGYVVHRMSKCCLIAESYTDITALNNYGEGMYKEMFANAISFAEGILYEYKRTKKGR